MSKRYGLRATLQTMCFSNYLVRAFVGLYKGQTAMLAIPVGIIKEFRVEKVYVTVVPYGPRFLTCLGK